jgi:microcystin-dependent protein
VKKLIHAFSISFLVLGLLQYSPASKAGVEPFVGEISWVPYNFAPRGWAFCDGQILQIAQNTALFSLLGTTYGGDGRTTFALPDVRSRMMVHAGQGPGLSPRQLGQKGGEENVTLSAAEMPSHNHSQNASTGNPTSASPDNNVLASPRRTRIYDNQANVTMAANTIGAVGGSQAHNNMPPYTVLHCIIALQGIYPSRN